TTRFLYGTTLHDSGIARADLLRAKIHPMSDDGRGVCGALDDGPDGVYERIEHSYNRQGEVATTKDPNGTVHAFDRNKLGQIVHDRITAFGPGLDETVQRISTVYNALRQIERIGSYDHADPESGTLLNEVAR